MAAQKPQSYVIRTRELAERVGAMVAGLAITDRPFEVIVRPFKKQRTPPQNNLYWKWLEIIGEEIGYEKDELHDVLREKFLPFEEYEVCGVRRKRLTSTSDPEFKTNDMSDYMDRIERFAAQELGILLPRPDDQHHEAMSRR